MQSGSERVGRRSSSATEQQAVRDSPYLKAISRETDDAFNIAVHFRRLPSSRKPSTSLMAKCTQARRRNRRLHFEADDFAAHRQVCIFGPHAATKLFNGYPPVGEVVQIEGQPFTVIGVLRNKIQDSSNNGPDNENVFVLPVRAHPRQQRDHQLLVFQPSSPDMPACKRSARCSASAISSTPKTPRPSARGHH